MVVNGVKGVTVLIVTVLLWWYLETLIYFVQCGFIRIKEGSQVHIAGTFTDPLTLPLYH